MYEEQPRAGAGRGELAVILLARLALNLQFRIVYPFLPAISRGLGVPLTSGGLLLTARSLTTAASPLLGLLADRYSRRGLMLGGLATLVAGCLLVTAVPTFTWALAAFALLGLAKAAYDPAMQAHVSDTVPYARRGRILSLLELSWSLAWLLGVPAAGLLIAAAGWRSPFLVVAALGGLCLTLAARTISAVPNGSGRKLNRPTVAMAMGASAPAPHKATRWRGADRLFLLASRLRRVMARWPAAARRLGAAAWLALLVNLMQVMAVENVAIVYGAWLEDRFGLSVSALGLASSVIALAEFAAETGAAGLVDRLGKRRSVLTGMLLSAAAYLLLPRLAGALAGALLGTSLLFLTFEFGIVASLPLVSELAPGARATVMALNVAAMSLGRMVASLSAPRLWAAGGLAANTTLSAAVILLAAAVLWRGVREARPAY